MSESQRQPDHWDWALLFLGLAGLSLSLIAAIAMTLLAAIMLLESDLAAAVYPAWIALAFAVVGAIGLPAVYLSARALRGHLPRLPKPPGSIWLLGVAILPVSLFMGYMAFETDTLSGIFGPPAHFLAAGSPVLITVVVSIQRGPEISLRRRWGHFLAGLWAVPPVSIVMEILALVPLIIALILGLSISNEGQALLAKLAQASSASEADLPITAMELLSFPWVILAIVAYLSLAVPLIEEAFKTMALWPLLRRRISPGEAFLAGVLGGAGYALFESLFIPQPGGEWLATMMARSGTPLIHAFNTGMTCWGLSQGVHHRRWLRMALAYLGAVVLHGLWNLGAVGLGLVGSFAEGEIGSVQPGIAMLLNMLGGGTLVALSVASMSGLLLLPGRLKGKTATLP